MIHCCESFKMLKKCPKFKIIHELWQKKKQKNLIIVSVLGFQYSCYIPWLFFPKWICLRLPLACRGFSGFSQTNGFYLALFTLYFLDVRSNRSKFIICQHANQTTESWLHLTRRHFLSQQSLYVLSFLINRINSCFHQISKLKLNFNYVLLQELEKKRNMLRADFYIENSVNRIKNALLGKIFFHESFFGVLFAQKLCWNTCALCFALFHTPLPFANEKEIYYFCLNCWHRWFFGVWLRINKVDRLFVRFINKDPGYIKPLFTPTPFCFKESYDHWCSFRSSSI